MTRQISSFHFRDHVMTVFLQASALTATTISQYLTVLMPTDLAALMEKSEAAPLGLSFVVFNTRSRTVVLGSLEINM